MDKEFLENVTFDELTIGRQGTLTRTLTQDDITLFAVMSGDVNPAHMDADYAKSDIFHGIIGQGMWTASLISALLGTVMPGVGTIYLEQDIKFKKPVRIGDTITVTAVVRDKRTDKPIVTLDCKAVNQRGEIVADGLATVLAPKDKLRVARADLPQINIPQHDRFNAILQRCEGLEALSTAVVHPVKADALQAVADAVKAKLIIPVLIGPMDKIKAAAKEARIDLSKWETVDTEHSHEAAAKAVELAVSGKVAAIMKGSLHTEELRVAGSGGASRFWPAH
jgi:phosphate acetyltransferase